MSPYQSIPFLHEIYLEESILFDLVIRLGSVRLESDFVLRPGHELYQGPRAGERYRFERGALEFSGVLSVQWLWHGIVPGTDRNGELDYGTFDRLDHDGWDYEVEGSFGLLKVTAAALGGSFGVLGSAG